MNDVQFLGLSIENVLRLTQVFKNQDWPIDNPDPGDDRNLFQNFCRLLSVLSQDEQELILTLTEDFHRYTYFDYPSLLLTALQQVNISLINNAEEVLLLALVSPKDVERGESKSGNALLYVTKYNVIPYHSALNTKRVRTLHTISALAERYHNRRNALLIFLDDFIGTGKTACECLEDYLASYRVASDSLIVVGLVVQERGLAALQDLGFDVVAAHVRKRGISDSERIADKDDALSIMDRIESRLLIDELFRRGYGKSEALVKMMRIPNNTFPVYWCPKTRDNATWPAPFRR